MDTIVPQIIINNENKNTKMDKKNYEQDLNNEEEEEGEKENKAFSEIKKNTSKNIIKNIKFDESEYKEIKKDIFDLNKQEKMSKEDSKNSSNILNITKIKGKSSKDILLKKLKEQEKELNEKNKVINDLRIEIKEKENKIKLISKTNNKLKISLDEFSKKIDEKLFNKNIVDYSKKSKSNIKNNNNDELNEKELKNAMNIIKILKKDNLRLQNAIDNYEKINKMRELESSNKIKDDQNINLENQIKVLKKELNDYNLCLKKCKIYESQLEILNKEIKSFKDNNKILKNKLSNQKQKNDYLLNENQGNKDYFSPKRIDNIFYVKKSKNMFNSNSNRYKINLYDNFKGLNDKEENVKSNNRYSNLQKRVGSLPTINSKSNINSKNNSPSGLNSYKKNYENNKDILKIFFNEDDIVVINKIFKNDLKGFESFKMKLCIINNSKEALNNKYNLEIRRYNERIKSAQEQIEYLNNKIRESEVNYRVLQTQMNEFNIQKKLLIKKIKALEENLIHKDNMLKLNLIEEENNDELSNKNYEIEKIEIDSKNTREDNEISKIANEIKSDNNIESDNEDDNKTENSQMS